MGMNELDTLLSNFIRTLPSALHVVSMSVDNTWSGPKIIKI